MTFTLWEGNQLKETWELQDHREALTMKVESGQTVRDRLLYVVNQETVRQCEVWESLDRLRNRNLIA